MKMKEVLFIVLLSLFASLSMAGYHPPSFQQVLSDAVRFNKKFDCPACMAATDLTKALFDAHGTEEELEKLITGFCIDFKIQNASVCEGIVNVFRDEFFFVLSSEISTDRICGWFFDVCPFPNVTYYNVTFPSPKPPHVAPVRPNPADPKFTILQISDMHFDVEYQQGMNNDCGEPLCCRASNGYGKTPNTTAGKWGDYQCDLNIDLLGNLAEHWQNMPIKPDFVFWTGDNPPHDVWLSTREENINNSAFLTTVLKKAFGDIPVFPCIGNHEGVPVNSFPLPPHNSWLMDALGDQWSVWLSEEAVASFKYGGYYATPLNSHIQVVSLNMNYCNSGNGWLLLNDSDPGQMLEWLVNVLETAESNQQKAYLVGHIPPGNHNCLPSWGVQFHQIVDRYEDTILAQFYGHTHNDQFEVFYDLENTTRATSIAYIIPSVTTYQQNNPSYRIFTADAATGYIVESSTYHTNITLANLQDSPEWVWEYNATSAYGMASLFPEDWAALIEKFETDDEAYALFYKYQYSSAPGNGPCDSACKKSQLCQMKSADSRLLSSCLYGHGMDLSDVAKESKC